MPVWKIIESSGAGNAANAAGATQELITPPTRAPYWNYIIIQNFDTTTDCEILFDSGDNLATARGQGKYKRIQFNGGTFILEPEDGFRFHKAVIRNPHASTAQTANAITFEWGYKVRVG